MRLHVAKLNSTTQQMDTIGEWELIDDRAVAVRMEQGYGHVTQGAAIPGSNPLREATPNDGAAWMEGMVAKYYPATYWSAWTTD